MSTQVVNFNPRALPSAIPKRPKLSPLPAGQHIDEIWDEMALVPAGIPTIKALQGVTPIIEFEPGLSIIAAPTSAGKTTVIVQQILEWLENPELVGKILVWSSETSRPRLWAKILANAAEATLWDVLSAARQGLLTTELHDAKKSLTDLTDQLIFLDEATTAFELCETASRLADEHDGVLAVVIDYIQELPAVPDNHDLAATLSRSRELEVGYVARLLREFGNRHGIPVIAAAQFNRTVAKNSAYVPDLLQLRESGRIEQNATLVIGLRNETMSGATPPSSSSTVPASEKIYKVWNSNELESARRGAMLAVRSEHPGGNWILEEAFVLKNRNRGGVGTVIPFAMNPASGRCEALERRLEMATEKKERITKEIVSQPEMEDDDWFTPAS